jgi:hypothetical protein
MLYRDCVARGNGMRLSSGRRVREKSDGVDGMNPEKHQESTGLYLDTVPATTPQRRYSVKAEQAMTQRALNTPPGFQTAEKKLLGAARLAERRLDEMGDWETAAHVRNAIADFRAAKGAR